MIEKPTVFAPACISLPKQLFYTKTGNTGFGQKQIAFIPAGIGCHLTGGNIKEAQIVTKGGFIILSGREADPAGFQIKNNPDFI